MEGLEFELWKARKGELLEIGRLVFDGIIIDQLNKLPREAIGWIIFDDNKTEVFVSFNDWNAILKTI